MSISFAELQIDREETQFMERALCAPHPGWTPDRAPSVETMAEYALVCYDCPVKRECAAYAIDRQLDNGIYAGVYVPTKLNEYQRRTQGFSAAMNNLASIAGRPPVRRRIRGVTV